MTITARRTVRCLIGRHRWHTVSTEDGSNHWQSCIRCGKDRPPTLEQTLDLPPAVWLG